MAEFIVYPNADTYSDGDIENEILALAEKGFDITRDGGKFPFAVAYHFSPERENILSWYPFKEGASCLEIGAGCGALTGALCKKCASVVSVDISERRSKINYLRHKDSENLKIIVGNIQQLEFERKFDYAVLNGVFEYALSFIHTDTPYLTLLQLVRSFLKPDGKLFIAIENRLGLKYFNGAAEDHTDNYFLGLNNYAGNDSVRTFSKEELTALIKESGFENSRFYYPYPDYKFPSEIFTDNTVNNGSFGAPYFNFNKRSFGLYSEREVASSFAREGIMDRFANSFLVEMTNGECDETIDYVKLNLLRREEFRIMTVIGGGMRAAYKMPMSAAAENHIANMHKNTDIYPEGIECISSEQYKNGLCYPFITARSLTAEIIENGSVSAVLKQFFGRFKTEKRDYFNEGFKKVFGDHPYGRLECICPANIDLICDNIFIDKGKYTVIDNEWTFAFPIPLHFIIWRCLNELYYKNPQLEQCESREDALRAFDINSDMCAVFEKWAVYFADSYVGENYLAAYACPLNEVSLLELYNARQQERVFSTSCYYDRGNGFSEDDKAFDIIELDGDGNFTVEFDIADDVDAFRWDPAENSFIGCRITEVEGGCLIADNAARTEDGYDIFYTVDPHYTLTGFGKYVKICGIIKYIDKTEIMDMFERNAAAYAARRSELEAAVAERDESIRIKDEAARVESRYVQQCESRIHSCFEKQVELNLAIERYQNELAASRAEHTRIINSRTWRLMSVFWRIKAKITGH